MASAANAASTKSADAGLDADDLLRRLVQILAEKRMRATDLFQKMDESGDGTLEAHELRSGLKTMGFQCTDEEFKVLMPRFDKDGGGDVSLREFDRAIKAAEKLGPPKKKDNEAKVEPKKKQGLTEEDKEEFRQIFALFKQLCRTQIDEDGNEVPLVDWDDRGSISVDELEQLLETVGMRISQSELDVMIGEIDKDGNGEIDFEEFCDKMSKRVQVPYSPDEIQKAFTSFSYKAPEGLIRVEDLRNALTTYMHKELTPNDVEDLLRYYKDSFVRIPGQDTEYFNFQDYIEIMAPMAPPGEAAASGST